MPAFTVFGQSWTREHDRPSTPLFPSVAQTTYPTSLQELIEICSDHPAGERLRAAGSHWALSAAAISDNTFIETHDPRGMRQAMGRTLTNVIPTCLNRDYLEWLDTITRRGEPPFYLVHVEAGKRVYQLYAELDQIVDTGNPLNFGGYMATHYQNAHFGGRWAFSTLGGAGGQTIVGALNTGTHGGDFDLPPIADSVRAIHLVADGGKHFWIEPTPGDFGPALTDDAMMSLEFRTADLGGPANFQVIRDDNMFNAVLVSAGRFGVIYSVVLSAVRQHNICERRRIHVWQDIKHDIKNLKGALYKDAPSGPMPDFVPSSPPDPKQRFLQIAICLTPHCNFQKNLVGITKRWDIEPPTPLGRDQRVGTLVNGFNPILQAPRFSNAGANYAHSYDPDKPYISADPGLLESACTNASFLVGVLETVIKEIEDFATSGGAIVGAGLATVLVPGVGGALALIPPLLALANLLKELLDHFDLTDTLGDAMNVLRKLLLDTPLPIPGAKDAGILAWQLIALGVFYMLQGDIDFEGISYAMMDRKDYLQQSCEVNVDSVEVFFDATDDRLIAYVDALINFEIMQEYNGRAFLGYATLRFMQRSRALLGQQKFDVTCSVEVACLKDMEGSQELVDYATSLALNRNINGLLHWGQRNDYTRSDVEFRYGADLAAWRAALATITEGGRLDGFSSNFSRRTGLEVA